MHHMAGLHTRTRAYVCSPAAAAAPPCVAQVENRRDGRTTHCGVLEFIADEGMVYMPYWVRAGAEGSCEAAQARRVLCLPGLRLP